MNISLVLINLNKLQQPLLDDRFVVCCMMKKKKKKELSFSVVCLQQSSKNKHLSHCQFTSEKGKQCQRNVMKVVIFTKQKDLVRKITHKAMIRWPKKKSLFELVDFPE